MNTPSHLILNLCAIGRDDPAKAAAPVAIGAVLPDAPMFLFFAYEKLWLGLPDEVIWGSHYFLPAWQDFFDIFNSIPIMCVGIGAALLAKHRGAALLFASMMLHAFLDLPLHHDDAHRHFFPLTDWRFESPVSYWDPNHYGWISAPTELAMAILGCALLARRHRSRRARVWLGLLAAIYASFIVYALVVWV